MIQTFDISTGVKLRCYQTGRFKQGRISLQLVRPMCREESAMNALLPAVLLRGTRKHPDLRAITMRLDDLYGAAVSDLVRRTGDLQTTGFICSFTEDRFALPGDRILEPVVDFLRELLLEPLTVDGIFDCEIVESEKKNRIADIESEFNDKRVYAANSLIRIMGREDSFGLPRIGDREGVAAITAEGLYAHYRRILREAPVEIFYVGSVEPQIIAGLLQPVFAGVDRQVASLPPHTPLNDVGGQRAVQETAATQSILNLGFVTEVTNSSPKHAAMRVFNTLFGAGMTSKLFRNVREKMSLCYSVGSEYYGAKGILVVAAGIDADQEQTVRREVLAQLEACKNGEITPEELNAAKESLLSGLRGVYESPGSIESFFSTRALSGIPGGVEEYRAAIQAVTAEDVAAAAAALREHSVFFLKGVGQ